MTTDVGSTDVQTDADGIQLTPEQVNEFSRLFGLEAAETRKDVEPFLVTDPAHVALLEHTANLLDAYFERDGLRQTKWRAAPEITLLRPERHSDTSEPIKVSLSIPTGRKGKGRGMREFHDAWKIGPGVWVAEWHVRREDVSPPVEGKFHSPVEGFFRAVEEIRDGLIASTTGHVALGSEIVPYEGEHEEDVPRAAGDRELQFVAS